ncbi:MAG: stage III sporulation protein AC [Oscillospiraceae bacterium]|nr:stage III sporulation protein AC [Oscillospiraceae bacterium]
MDISLLLKIAGVGILVAVFYQVVSKFGGDDQAKYVSIAGIIIVILMLINEIGNLYETIQSVFGI